MADNFTSESRRVLVPQDGAVQFTSETAILEKDISDSREAIVRRLDAAYLHVLEEMEEFQAQWSAGPMLALYTAWEEGRLAGMKEWAGDQGDLFKAETWTALGDQVQGWASSAYDRLYTYGANRAKEFAENYSVLTENPDGTILNWAWWKTTASEAIETAVEQKKRELNAALQRANQMVDGVVAGTEKAKKIYAYRQQIFRIPELIAQGDGEAIMAFIRGPLNEIDPEMSKNILRNPDLPYAIALVQDHDSLLTYLSYVTLILEAVPPNFYVYTAGKGATYVALEVVLNVVLGLLTEGAFVAARLATLMARFAVSSKRVAGAMRTIKKADAAIQSFRRSINEFIEAKHELMDLGRKINFARPKSLVVKGRTKETLRARKDNVKRDKRCKCCGSSAHASPRNQGNSVLVYR